MSIASVINASEGPKSDPNAGTLLADTGAISVSSSGPLLVADLSIVLSNEDGAVASTSVDVQHRNAANDGNISTHRIHIDAKTTFTIPFVFAPADQERLRVIVVVGPGTTDIIHALITGKLLNA